MVSRWSSWSLGPSRCLGGGGGRQGGGGGGAALVRVTGILGSVVYSNKKRGLTRRPPPFLGLFTPAILPKGVGFGCFFLEMPVQILEDRQLAIGVRETLSVRRFIPSGMCLSCAQSKKERLIS